ncbi:MAG: DUF1957 domain-containing protein [Actinobacteria bacterium]|nr:DUF1957 domain-containing protein [Actinomycetota bacterium]
MKGYISLVLHTHMPYVRKNGVFPVGEDWLYQVMSNTYLPLLGMLAQLEHEGLSSCLSITLTPILCEQLSDPYVQERFIAYLRTMSKRASSDINDFEHLGDDRRKELAEAYQVDYQRKLAAFTSIDGDLLGAISSFERLGLVETVASSATHAFLQGLADWRSVEAQVLLGIESHRRSLGVNPAGFWIPELAYRKGLENILEAEGLRYVLIDPSGLQGLPPTYPYYAGNTSVAAIARSDRAHDIAWDAGMGYPTDGNYMDSTKYYQSSGLHYWKVTGLDVPIEEKDIYDPDAAIRRAFDHGSHFIGEVEREIEESVPCPPPPPGAPPPGAGERKRRAVGALRPLPMVLASYDTEFLGHGWHEGIYWLEVTLRSLAASKNIKATVPSRYLDGNQPAGSVSVAETTWAAQRDDSTWVNPETQWMWDELGKAQEKFFELAPRFRDDVSPETSRALTQAAREILILEASDWPFMVARDRAKEYATQRFKSHLERFWSVSTVLESGEADKIVALLQEIEEVDKIFTGFDLDCYWPE